MLSINTRPSPHSQGAGVSVVKSATKDELSELPNQASLFGENDGLFTNQSTLAKQHRPAEVSSQKFMRKTTSGALCLSSMTSLSPPREPLPEEEESEKFAQRVREQSNGAPEINAFTKELREAMEPHLRKARLKREKSRDQMQLNVDASIASSVGVPYTSLRQENRFLFDEHTHPLHQVLSETLGVQDLACIHELKVDKRQLLRPLLDRRSRQRFHECYDSFVTSFCIPLLHAMGMSKNIFHTTSHYASNRITYRYQAFPTIQVVRPGDAPCVGPHCARADGHSIGCLTFHIPLSSSYGTNAMYVESHPGREDWHPLTTKSVGLGYLFDGARCMHFDLVNTTKTTRVSLDFVVLIYREGDSIVPSSNGLCSSDSLEDNFSRAGPGYYEEAMIDLGVGVSSALHMVAKKH